MSSVASKTSYLTHCTFNSCTRHQKLLSHRKGVGPSPVECPCLILQRQQRPLENGIVIPLPGSLLTHRHSNHFFFPFTVLHNHKEKKNLFLNIQPTRVPQKHTVTHSTFSVHMLTAETFESARLGTNVCIKETPNYHAPQSLRRLIHDFIFSPQNTFIKGSWRQLGRVQNGMLWLEQASLITRLFSLEAA